MLRRWQYGFKMGFHSVAVAQRYGRATGGLVLCALTLLVVEADAHEPQEKAVSPAAAHAVADQLSRATGVVFHDANGDGKRNAGESGIEGVKLSNGRDIVTTDAEGRYALQVSNDAIVFVIKPRGWAVPLNHNNLPQFYYIHKPAGSPANYKFAGVAPTGPLPASIDFPLTKQDEPDRFKALLFGDPQPRNNTEVEYIAHDVVEQIIAAEGHQAAFGVTLGDIAFDNLATFEPLNQAIALIGIPWYNVIGNHDLNFEAANDQLSDETFESIYGPSYYSFDYGPTHFLVLDDVEWHATEGDKKAHFHGGLGAAQLEFIRKDLTGIPENQLVVLLMHIPLIDVADRAELYRLIEQRPASLSISAHTHYMEHRFIGQEDGWMGPERHHHLVNVTVCGSWWRGQPDERGIPHATMSDGGPNGYSLMTFDGDHYELEFHAASRPADYQMNIYAPESVSPQQLANTVVVANVFVASEQSKCRLRVGDSAWVAMERITIEDPAYVAEKKRELALADRTWTELPSPHASPHMFRASLPAELSLGSHTIEIDCTTPNIKPVVGRRIIRVEAAAAQPEAAAK